MDGWDVGMYDVLLNAAGEVHGSIGGIRIFWEDPGVCILYCATVHVGMRGSGVM
jgi:hypothetical protein